MFQPGASLAGIVGISVGKKAALTSPSMAALPPATEPEEEIAEEKAKEKAVKAPKGTKEEELAALKKEQKKKIRELETDRDKFRNRADEAVW